MAIENLTDEYGNLLPPELGNPGDVLTVNSAGDASAWAAPSGGGGGEAMSGPLFSLTQIVAKNSHSAQNPFSSTDTSELIGSVSNLQGKHLLLRVFENDTYEYKSKILYSDQIANLNNTGDRILWAISNSETSGIYRSGNNLYIQTTRAGLHSVDEIIIDPEISFNELIDIKLYSGSPENIGTIAYLRNKSIRIEVFSDSDKNTQYDTYIIHPFNWKEQETTGRQLEWNLQGGIVAILSLSNGNVSFSTRSNLYYRISIVNFGVSNSPIFQPIVEDIFIPSTRDPHSGTSTNILVGAYSDFQNKDLFLAMKFTDDVQLNNTIILREQIEDLIDGNRIVWVSASRDVALYRSGDNVYLISSTLGSASFYNITPPSSVSLRVATNPITGDMLYYNGSSWVSVGPGTDNQLLKWIGGRPRWSNA